MPMAYSTGLRKPTGGWPLAAACWLISAVKAAHSGAAQLVPPKSPAALAEALGRLWTDPELARRLGAYGRDTVVPRFSWDALADRLDAIYREVTRR